MNVTEQELKDKIMLSSKQKLWMIKNSKKMLGTIHKLKSNKYFVYVYDKRLRATFLKICSVPRYENIKDSSSEIEWNKMEYSFYQQVYFDKALDYVVDYYGKLKYGNIK